MKELCAEVEIEATPDRVWRLLTDFPKFPEWNPFIRWARGPVEPGGRLEIHIQPSGASGMTFRPTLLKVEPQRELRWLGRLFLPGLFDGEHSFTIEALGDHRVRFVQREVFRGILVPLLSRSLDRDTLRGFGEMNAALKSRAEQR